MKKQTLLLIDTIVLGIVGALGAQIFDFLLKIVQEFSLQKIADYLPPVLVNEGGNLTEKIGSHGMLFVPLVIILGGIISGVLVYTLAPEAEGHGTDTAVKSFHQSSGKIRTRVTPVKILASAITIGTGGSAGREGPTALFSAGIGSIYASITKRSDSHRRSLVLIGMAAGLSAIFRSPIGTAIFAVEVLYRDMEFETPTLIYTMLASIIAYAINGIFVGWKPLFQVPANVGVSEISDYLWYILLGLASGVLGTIIPPVFYRTRDLFHKIPIKPHFKPTIGAVGVGLIALAYPQVVGGGYGWIQKAINGQLVANLLVALIFMKLIAFALTVSSGGSGGVFAPTLYVGSMLGGLFAILFHQSPAAFAIVGMAAVFGSAARVPIATLLMVAEMTGGYQLLVPAGLSVILAFLIQNKLSKKLKYKSLYEAQVRRMSDSPAHRLGHLHTAVRLLSERREFNNLDIEHLDFISLLKSDITLNMPDGKKLFFGTLKKDSLCVGTKVKDNCLLDKQEYNFEIAGILRDENLIIPHPYTVLERDDQLIVFGSDYVIEKLKKEFAPKD